MNILNFFKKKSLEERMLLHAKFFVKNLHGNGSEKLDFSKDSLRIVDQLLQGFFLEKIFFSHLSRDLCLAQIRNFPMKTQSPVPLGRGYLGINHSAGWL